MVEVYGDRLEKGVLYGSRARGDNREDSDFDFLVVLKDKQISNMEEIERVWPFKYALWEECYIPIHFLPMEADRFYNAKHPCFIGYEKKARKFDMGKEEAILLLAKAEECLKAARLLFDSGFYPDSVNRSYYAVFNAMQCVLQMKDIMVKTHHDSHVQFNQQFIKTGIFSGEIGGIPQKIEEVRLKGDYEFGQQISKNDAETAISRATLFCEAVKKFFTNYQP